jgi:hypothetical protein
MNIRTDNNPSSHGNAVAVGGNFFEQPSCSALGYMCGVCRAKTPHGDLWRKAILARYSETPYKSSSEAGAASHDFECPKGVQWDGKTIKPRSKFADAKILKWIPFFSVFHAVCVASLSSFTTIVLRRRRAPETLFDRRMKVCRNCEFVKLTVSVDPDGSSVSHPHTCGEMKNIMTGESSTCGCILKLKARDENEHCPQGKW